MSRSLFRSRYGIPVLLAAALLAALSPAGAQQAVPPETSARELVRLAQREPESAAMREALLRRFSREALRAGAAYAGEGAEFLFAVESGAEPRLLIDDEPQPPMRRVPGCPAGVPGEGLWVAAAKLHTGRSHAFHYLLEGNRHGGNLNVPAYAPDSYQQPGVPEGRLVGPLTHASKIYDGMESRYWIYVPAQYVADVPAAVMVWQDGQGHLDRRGTHRTLNVVDNLIHRDRIPVMIQVFVQPGDISKAAGTPTHAFVSEFSRRTGRTLADSMRSTEYDTVSDRYVRFLRDELLAEVGAKYSLRRDAYSRGIAGDSSGAIAAFNAAWQIPDQFSRVLSRIGTYTSIQWQPGVLDGGNIFPFLVRKSPRKNLRVWLSDGSEDAENAHGSWPLQNIQMANSLKMQGYDFRFSFGNGSHHGAHGAAEAPEALAWLWRGYDRARSEALFEMEPEERARPLFRVRVYNREP